MIAESSLRQCMLELSQHISWALQCSISIKTMVFLTEKSVLAIVHDQKTCFMCIGVDGWGLGLLLKQPNILLAKNHYILGGWMWWGRLAQAGMRAGPEEECCWCCVDGDAVWAVLVCSVVGVLSLPGSRTRGAFSTKIPWLVWLFMSQIVWVWFQCGSGFSVGLVSVWVWFQWRVRVLHALLWNEVNVYCTYIIVFKPGPLLSCRESHLWLVSWF